MFDLEQSIDQWRKQMLADGIKTQALDELENHLREDFERHVNLGMPQPDALKIAIDHIGTGAAITSEFKKVREPIAFQPIKLVGIAFTVIAVVLMLLILPPLFHHATGVGPKLAGLMAVAAIPMSWRYGQRFLPVIRHPWIRAAIVACSCIAVWFGMNYYLRVVVPESLARAVETDQAFASFTISCLWIWSAVAIFGVLIYGLEKTAQKNQARHA